MVWRAPFPQRSLPADIELFNKTIVCAYNCIFQYYYFIITSLLCHCYVIIVSLLQMCNNDSIITYYYIGCFYYNSIIAHDYLLLPIITYF